MNMSLSEEVIKILDALAEKVGMVIDWTSENVLPYLEKLCGKYVNYEIAISVIWLLFGLCFLIIAILLFKKTKIYFGKSNGLDDNNGYSYACIATAIFFGIFVITGISVVMNQLFDIVTCITFPEKLILEELRTLYITMQQTSTLK